MPAPIKIRPSYTNDSQYLMRLKRAVEKDERISNDCKTNLLGMVDALVMGLIGADSEVRMYKEQERTKRSRSPVRARKKRA